MMDFTLFCAGCAREMSYQKAWRDTGLSKALVCGKECLDKVQLAYCAMIVGANKKPVPDLDVPLNTKVRTF